MVSANFSTGMTGRNDQPIALSRLRRESIKRELITTSLPPPTEPQLVDE